MSGFIYGSINLPLDQFITGMNLLWRSTPSHFIPPCTSKRALCLIRLRKGFLFILKLHTNRIICAEVGSDNFEIIYQTSSVVKYFISFFHCFHEILTIVSFHSSPKWRLYFWEFSAAINMESISLMDLSSNLQLIRSMCSMVALNID